MANQFPCSDEGGLVRFLAGFLGLAEAESVAEAALNDLPHERVFRVRRESQVRGESRDTIITPGVPAFQLTW